MQSTNFKLGNELSYFFFFLKEYFFFLLTTWMIISLNRPEKSLYRTMEETQFTTE